MTDIEQCTQLSERENSDDDDDDDDDKNELADHNRELKLKISELLEVLTELLIQRKFIANNMHRPSRGFRTSSRRKS